MYWHLVLDLTERAVHPAPPCIGGTMPRHLKRETPTARSYREASLVRQTSYSKASPLAA